MLSGSFSDGLGLETYDKLSFHFQVCVDWCCRVYCVCVPQTGSVLSDSSYPNIQMEIIGL